MLQLSSLPSAKKISDELAAKFKVLHQKSDVADKILAQAMEAAIQATVNVNTALEAEREELVALLNAEVGEGDWAIDTKTGYVADRMEMNHFSQHGR